MVWQRIGMVLMVATAVLVIGTDRGGAAGRFFGWEPFRVMQELRLEIPEAGRGLVVLSGLDIAPERIAAGNAASVPVGVSRESAQPDLRIGAFRLFLSRSGGEGSNREWFPSGYERGGALDMLKALPGAFRTDPSRALVDSVGKLFEPQLNLGIEF